MSTPIINGSKVIFTKNQGRTFIYKGDAAIVLNYDAYSGYSKLNVRGLEMFISKDSFVHEFDYYYITMPACYYKKQTLDSKYDDFEEYLEWT